MNQDANTNSQLGQQQTTAQPSQSRIMPQQMQFGQPQSMLGQQSQLKPNMHFQNQPQQLLQSGENMASASQHKISSALPVQPQAQQQTAPQSHQQFPVMNPGHFQHPQPNQSAPLLSHMGRHQPPQFGQAQFHPSQSQFQQGIMPQQPLESNPHHDDPALVSTMSIKNLCAEISNKDVMDNQVERSLQVLAEDIINNVSVFACQMAKHRGSKTLEKIDIEFAFKKLYNITNPNFISNQVGVNQQAVAGSSMASTVQTSLVAGQNNNQIQALNAISVSQIQSEPLTATQKFKNDAALVKKSLEQNSVANHSHFQSGGQYHGALGSGRVNGHLQK